LSAEAANDKTKKPKDRGDVAKDQPIEDQGTIKEEANEKKEKNEDLESKKQQDSKTVGRNKISGNGKSLLGRKAMLVARLEDMDDANNSVERVTVPDEFPQIIPIPLNKRPLFPGFYKSLYIKDPAVIQAIHNLIERRRPYVGVFLTKDDDLQGDVVKNLDDVYRTGVFAQITNTYQTGPDSSALTVVLYPHRRIRIKSKDLIAPPAFFKEKDSSLDKGVSKTIEPPKGGNNDWMGKF
jgi:Lon-like ATP-dependent protease